MILRLFRQRKTQRYSNTPRRKRYERKGHPGIIRMPRPMASRVHLTVAEHSIAAADEDQGQTDTRRDGGLRRRLSPHHGVVSLNRMGHNDFLEDDEMVRGGARAYRSYCGTGIVVDEDG